MKRRNFISGTVAAVTLPAAIAAKAPKQDASGGPENTSEAAEWTRQSRLINRAHELLQHIQIRDLLAAGVAGVPDSMGALIPREEHKDRMSYFLLYGNEGAVEQLAILEHSEVITSVKNAKGVSFPLLKPDLVPKHQYRGLHYINDVASTTELIPSDDELGFREVVRWSVVGEPIIELQFKVDGTDETLRVATGIPAEDPRRGVESPPVPVPHFVIQSPQRLPLIDLLEYLDQKYAQA